ncbi:MAG TPA: hypothetical protein VEC99_13885 [Clostridia bacterium]|nr:hypothetical protein [Clostridia bacterium]
MRKALIGIAIGIFLLLLILTLRSGSNQPFAKYIGSPVPKSVRVVFFQSNDWLEANPEPVCYLAFTATAGDIAQVIQQGGFRPTAANDGVPVPSGPPGWVSADQVVPGGRVYSRSHSPAGVGRLPLGRNRRWSEYLWIDKTGTNAYFLLWGV